MKVNLKKDSLNDKLKKNFVPVRVFEKGNDYLVFKFLDSSRDMVLFLFSLTISPLIMNELISKVPRSLYDRISFLLKLDNCSNMILFGVILLFGIAFFTYLFLRLFFYFFLELRFIGNKLIIAKKDGKQEIALNDKVKFSIEKKLSYNRQYLYKLNVTYYCDFYDKRIDLFTFSNHKGAELILERINKYLEQINKL